MFDARCLIGHKFDDAEVQSDVKHYPFRVVNKGGKPIIQVEFRGESKEFVSMLPHFCHNNSFSKCQLVLM